MGRRKAAFFLPVDQTNTNQEGCMLIRKLKDCEPIIAGDGTRLRELLHPNRPSLNRDRHHNDTD
jgi:hypothetical protein